jgi:large-conductance mechanosensitive channel
MKKTSAFAKEFKEFLTEYKIIGLAIGIIIVNILESFSF